MPFIRVLNVSFECPLPYTSGHVIGASEAAALNRVRTNSVMSLARRMINTQGIRDSEVLSKMAREFVFSEESYAPPPDPQSIEALKIAKGLLREQMTKRGESIETLGAERYDALLHELASNEAVRGEAERRVSARLRIGDEILKELL